MISRPCTTYSGLHFAIEVAQEMLKKKGISYRKSIVTIVKLYLCIPPNVLKVRPFMSKTTRFWPKWTKMDKNGVRPPSRALCFLVLTILRKSRTEIWVILFILAVLWA